MEKHLMCKNIILLCSVLSLISCGKLRDIEQTDGAVVSINLEIDESLRDYSGNMAFTNKNTGTSALFSIGFYLLPNDVGGTLTVESVISENQGITFDVKDSVLNVVFTNAVQPGENYSVQIEYSGTVPTTLTSPGIFVRTADTIALGSFYPLLHSSFGVP